MPLHNYYIYSSQANVDACSAQIDTNLGFHWADPFQRLTDSKWCIEVPEDTPEEMAIGSNSIPTPDSTEEWVEEWVVQD